VVHAAADVLHGPWHPCVVPASADAFVENLDGTDEIVAAALARCIGGPVVEIQQLEPEAQSEVSDDDVLHVQVAVVFAHQVDLFDAPDQRVQQMQAYIGLQSVSWRGGHELLQHHAFDIFRNQHRDRRFVEQDLFLGMVLDQDRGLPELVQLAGVELRGFVRRVAVREEELGGTLNAGAQLADFVNLALPAVADFIQYLVFIGNAPPGLEVEDFYQIACGHGSDPPETVL
jgi:hypothetical protein